MSLTRPVELLQEVVDLLRQLTDQGRAWSADDLLTAEEARRRLRAGKDNREARALLDRTERTHAPGDARWRWGDVLDALRVAVATGARTSELTSIDRTSIQRLDEGWLELRGKTGPRAVYVDPEGPAACALRAWLAEHERLAPRWGSSSLRQVLRRACRRALVPSYTPYALRRAFAGKLRRAGMDVTERAAIMGHSAAVHLTSYDRAQPDDLRAGMAGAKLEELPDGVLLAFPRRQA